MFEESIAFVEARHRVGDLPEGMRDQRRRGGEHAERARAEVEQRYPHVDVVVYDGGQQRYPLLMSVE